MDPLLDEDKVLQAKHDPAMAGRKRLQRHPIQPPADSLKAARAPFRKVAEAKRIFGDGNTQADIREAIRRFAHSSLSKAEYDAKKGEIEALEWTLDDDRKQPNPAQAGPGGITIFYWHENYYFPDGSPRVEFIKTVMLHEALHATSINSTGFQALDKSYTKNLKSDSVDEAVTDKLGAELAGSVLGGGEKYTSQYWNVLGRKGMDFHITSAGMERLADSPPSVWLGDLVDVITTVVPGLTWPQIKRAYISNEGGQHEDVKQKITAKNAEIETAWTAKRTAAFTALMGAEAIPAAQWETNLTAAVKALDGKVLAPTAYTSDEVRGHLEAELLASTGAAHAIVAKTDRRSSSKDDWAIVNRIGKTNTNVKPPATSWKATGTGMSPSQAAQQAETLAVTQAKDAKPMHVREFDGGLWAALGSMEKHVRASQRILGMAPDTPKLSWVLIPKPKAVDDPAQHKVGDRLETYVSSSQKGLLDDKNKEQTLGTLTGDDPKQFAHATVAGYGGAGYEANGDIAFVTQEHVNLATVLHEMGHHKQKHEGLSEDTVGGIPKLLDFHNMILNENKLASDDIRTGRDPDPYVRLRYTSDPARLRVSEWRTLAQAKAQKEGDAYTSFRERLFARGGAYARLLREIEGELAGNAVLYPGNVGFLFKNYMIAEIKASKQDVDIEDPCKAGSGRSAPGASPLGVPWLQLHREACHVRHLHRRNRRRTTGNLRLGQARRRPERPAPAEDHAGRHEDVRDKGRDGGGAEDPPPEGYPHDRPGRRAGSAARLDRRDHERGPGRRAVWRRHWTGAAG